ncbi:group II intron reverse transcriptase/maturase [Acidithiobacillus thiooxidans]|uniref:group II intron reverse transcriptase/maturase n=1 Tax=Acidithiobacillus thiooxidans TaxID=930 RepID=UPI001C0697F8|nr:group II intron reverse transcriptase/maturase [Acidithiobacillus thiooxidans]MBU2834776.1 group II intron reverse transcriptase/maturase [Acidithiobacillus thiooxidans]
MNVATSACAPSHCVDWHRIDWSKATKHVQRLQARIVKAVQKGRWGKVTALQHLLTHSFSGKALAVRRVTSNQGKKTPGVDGKIWSSPEEKAQAVLSLRRQGYQPSPLKRVYIPKKNGKKRPLGIPTIRDRGMQALYKLALEPVAETTADLNSYGFRPERSTADAAEACFKALAKKASPKWILEGDIKGCFDNISHDWMIANISMDKVILRKWLKAGFMDKGALFPTEAGTPQGGIISPILANMALDGLEKLLRKEIQRNTHTGKKVNMVRYADDFIITGKSKDLLENEVKPLVEQFLKERGLVLSPEKTKITHIRDGFNFLGWNIRKYGRQGKYLQKPAENNTSAFLRKVVGIIKGNKAIKQEKLIALLNPIIRGWGNYHQHSVAKETYSSMDHALWEHLWQWAKRRHPNKGSQWIKEKYFQPRGSRNWVFTCKDENGKEWTLLKLSDTKIVRHVKIKGEVNPFDPKWETYREDRLAKHMALSLKGRNKLLRHWKEQNGNCAICGEKITRETGWHLHHIIRTTDGGPDTHRNRVLLHPQCYNQVHIRKLEAVTTGFRKGS